VRTPGGAAALAVLCAASFLAVVDTTIVTIALPSIRTALGFSPGGSQWVLTAYALVFGGLLLLSGRLADRVGRRRAFLAGLVVFAAGSVLAGLAPAAGVLIAGRVVQGLGAAAFVPSSLSLLTATFRGERERSRALAAYGAMAGLGFVAGMVGGGVITDLWGWRWIFLGVVPVVLLTLLAALRVLPESRDERPGRLDVAGALTVTAGLVLLILAITTGPQDGWLSVRTGGAAVLGVAALAGFVAVERRHPAPLLPAGVVVRPAVLASNGAVTLQSMVGVAWLYLLTQWFQDVRGENALVTGLLFAPMTAASLIGAAGAGRSAVRFGPRATAVTGLVLVAAGLVTMAQAMPSSSLAATLTGMVVGEAGFMLGSVALTIVATGSLDDRHAGLAAGLLNTATQLGGGVGLGIVSAVVTAATAGGRVTAGGLQSGFLTCVAFTGLALVLVSTGLRARH
jgi:EmrB/QacA subfamily drug resistance transporter